MKALGSGIFGLMMAAVAVALLFVSGAAQSFVAYIAVGVIAAILGFIFCVVVGTLRE